MTTFHDIIGSAEFDSVWQVLTAQYENIEDKKEAFHRIFDLLQSASIEENYQKMSIKICQAEEPYWILDDDEEENDKSEQPSMQAVGLVPGDEEYYSIGQKEPGQLAGLWLEEETVKEYSPAEIAAYCIAEITYFYSAADTVWGSGGIAEAQSCGGGEGGSVTIDQYRREIGALEGQEKSGTARFFD